MVTRNLTYCARCNLYGVLRKYANLFLCDDCIKFGQRIARKYSLHGYDLEAELNVSEWIEY